MERTEIEPRLERVQQQTLIFHPEIRRLMAQALLPSSGVQHLELTLREFGVKTRPRGVTVDRGTAKADPDSHEHTYQASRHHLRSSPLPVRHFKLQIIVH